MREHFNFTRTKQFFSRGSNTANFSDFLKLFLVHKEFWGCWSVMINLCEKNLCNGNKRIVEESKDAREFRVVGY